MEHALREYARSGFGRALGTGAAARNCERSVYNWAVQETRKVRDDPSWENKVFRWRYKQKVYGLLKELERSPVAAADLQVVGDVVKLEIHVTSQLARRLQLKELDTKNLARYSADVLWPGGPYAKKAFDIKSKDLAMEEAKTKEEDYSGMFTCKRCKSNRTTFYLLQTRSADEPMTAFITCMSCGRPYAKKAFDIKSKDLAMEEAKTKEEDYSGMFTCKKCYKKKVTYTQAQTRSADEPSTFLFCLFALTFVLTRRFSDDILLLPRMRKQVEGLKSTKNRIDFYTDYHP